MVSAVIITRMDDAVWEHGELLALHEGNMGDEDTVFAFSNCFELTNIKVLLYKPFKEIPELREPLGLFMVPHESSVMMHYLAFICMFFCSPSLSPPPPPPFMACPE